MGAGEMWFPLRMHFQKAWNYSYQRVPTGMSYGPEKDCPQSNTPRQYQLSRITIFPIYLLCSGDLEWLFTHIHSFKPYNSLRRWRLLFIDELIDEEVKVQRREEADVPKGKQEISPVAGWGCGLNSPGSHGGHHWAQALYHWAHMFCVLPLSTLLKGGDHSVSEALIP